MSAPPGPGTAEPTRRALLLGSAAPWPAAAAAAAPGRGGAGGRGAATGRVRRALQGRLPIEALTEAEQDAVFDGMLAAYADPPAGVGDRLAGVAARTREALDGESARRRDAAARTTGAERGAAPAAADPAAAAEAGGAGGGPG